MAAPCNNPHPWLALQYGENQVFCDVVSNAKTRIIRPVPNFTNRSVLRELDNPAGWLITRSTGSNPVQLCLWNVATQESIVLPLLDQESADSIRIVELTENPDHPDCVILMWINRAILFCYINRDDNGWTCRDYSELEEIVQFDSPENNRGMRDFYAATVCDGKNIFMIGEAVDFMFMKIEIMDPKTMVITRLPCERPPLYYLSDIPYYVACSSGDLFLIDVSFGGVSHKEDGFGEEIIRVTVFKLDFSDMSWKIVRACPNVSFFITTKNAFLASSSDSVEAGNRVYILTKENEFLYTYYIQENAIQKTPLASLLPHVGPSLTAPLPYWVLISDPSLLKSAVEVYHHGGNGGEDDKKDHSLVNVDTYDDMLSLHFSDLPLDILWAIYSHLDNPMDHLNFRASKRQCRSLVSPKGWRSMLSNINSPWLIIPSLVDTDVSSLVDPVSNSKCYLNLSTIWDDSSIICCSSKGWLLIRYLDNFSQTLGKGLRLYNPITKSTINIPETPPHFHGYDEFYFFTSSPTPHGFFVCGINISKYNAPTLRFTKLGDKEWYEFNNLEFSTELIDRMNVNQSNIDHVCIRDSNGSIYFLVGDENLAAFIMTEEGYEFKTHHFTLPCSSSYEQRFLVGCNTMVLSIYIGNEWLKVFQWDESDMVWQEKEEIDNYNIYLSSGSCIMREAKFPEKGNKVYLPRFHQGRIVYYCFRTRKFHAGKGDSSMVVSYYETKEQLQSCWFEPRWN